jgi:hypothetical protein
VYRITHKILSKDAERHAVLFFLALIIGFCFEIFFGKEKYNEAFLGL